jgi:hypothetical protein
MSQTDAQARGRLLDTLAEAVDALGDVLASLGEAYELVDDFAADRLEAALFKPAQAAYGRARRTHAEFAQRFGLPGQAFAARSPGVDTNGARGRIDDAVAAVREADAALVELQDSMLPIEYGDVELRAGISETRELMAPLAHNAREFVRTLGR